MKKDFLKEVIEYLKSIGIEANTCGGLKIVKENEEDCRLEINFTSKSQLTDMWNKANKK